MEEQAVIQMINQLHLLKGKLLKLDLDGNTKRQINRINQILDDAGYLIIDPTGQPYDSMRSDLEVSLSGPEGAATISEVLKPVVYRKRQDTSILVQKGVAIV